MLRFLTGLAMLALAFAAQWAPGQLATAVPAPPAAVAEVQAVPEVQTPGPVETAVRAAVPLSTPIAPLPMAPLLVGAAVVVLAGVSLRSHAVRGPPLS
ncbi:hypothetical protein [Paractinoplanes maris]|uniref:hypothetical protein n=1 Tax=Paractinoplanes maris TaxID=1734446 RepID=UPI002020F256|nr:hypothetical protein [Actinoplanes maris]